MVHVAKLFPDMGHRYWFLPFDKASTESKSVLQSVIAFAVEPEPDDSATHKEEVLAHFSEENLPAWASNRCERKKLNGDSGFNAVDPWRVYVHRTRKDANTWHAVPWPWIRWRLGSRPGAGPLEVIKGIEVCIESNVGPIARGIPVGPPEPRSDIVASTLQQTPYVSKTVEMLPGKDDPATILAFFLPQSYADADGITGVVSEEMRRGWEEPGGPPPNYDPARGKSEIHGIIGQPGDAPKGWVRVQEFHVWWPAKVATESVDVELIVDFGNSRSAAVLFAHLKQNGTELPLKEVIQPVLIRRPLEEPSSSDEWRNDPNSIFESWLLLRKPTFAKFWDTRNHGQNMRHWSKTTELKPGIFQRFQRLKGASNGVQYKVEEHTFLIPQMFMESSPVLLGAQAREGYQELDMRMFGSEIYLGSPKRYVSDTDPVEVEWGQLPAEDANPTDLKQYGNLEGLPMGFIYVKPVWNDEMEEEWSIHTPPHLEKKLSQRPELYSAEGDAKYARSEMMTLAALKIIETAYRQVGAFNLEQRMGFRRYRLSRISVTYPPGWTMLEKRIYRRKWRSALNIFSWLHLAEPKEQPISLELDCDEALAAQLPIIYGEILAMGNFADRWLQLIGRPAPPSAGAGAGYRARVMTVDIGGGTTDYAIVEYSNRQAGMQGAALEATLLFKDSSTTAGDGFLKRIIEDVLLPTLGSKLCTTEVQKNAFRSFFISGKGGSSGKAEEWKRVVRLVLVELATHWLRQWAAGDKQLGPPKLNHKNYLRDMLKNIGLDLDQVELEIMPFSRPAMQRAVDQEFSSLFDLYGILCQVFEVDMVVLSGKPSELPGVQNLLIQHLPLSPDRIVSAKDHLIGDWYPFATDRKIKDAKTVTVTGAALFRAIVCGHVPDWEAIKPTTHPQIVSSCRWQQITGPRPTSSDICYFEGGPQASQQEKRQIRMRIETQIGRALFKHQRQVEPVYKLKWKHRYANNKWGNLGLEVTLARRPASEEEGQEGLLLESVRIAKESVENLPAMLAENADDLSEFVELKLWTLPKDQLHWMDQGSFGVHWDAYEQAVGGVNAPAAFAPSHTSVKVHS